MTREGRLLAKAWTHPSFMTVFVHLFIRSVIQKVTIMTLNIIFSVVFERQLNENYGSFVCVWHLWRLGPCGVIADVGALVKARPIEVEDRFIPHSKGFEISGSILKWNSCDDLGPLHTWDWEPVTITLQVLSLVETAEAVQVRFTQCLRDQRSSLPM